MPDDERDREIEVYINRWAKRKIPRNAPQDAWRTFHSNWSRERMSARDLAIEVYRGHSFAPVFDGRKTKSHFVAAWHVALDFDCADKRAQIETLLEDDLINWFASFIYYTPSSRPPKFKSRVVFILDEPVTSVDEYEEILSAFAWRFPDSDQSTTDAARFFYGSKGAKLYDNWSILGRAAADMIVEQWRAAQPAPPPPPAPFNPDGVEEEEIADALNYIPKQMDYNDWLAVLMAVHSVFPGNRGIQLCESWSPGYAGEIEDKFASFERTQANGITARTLFKMARDNGWRSNSSNGNGRRNYRASRNDLRSVI